MPATAKRHPISAEDTYLLRFPGDPRISPDGRRVAYVVRTNDREKDQRQSSIYVAPIDGKSPAQRFTFGTKDHSPRWSPDGRYLAFIAERGEKNQIYLAPLHGGEPRQLTKAQHGVNDLAWSPDSTRVAYVARTGEYKETKDRDPAGKSAPRVIKHLRYRLDGIGYFDNRRTHIFTIDVESGDEAQITDGDWYDQAPSWSPNGKWIAFSSDRERRRHDRQFLSDAWVVAATGGRARRLTRGRGAANFPSFSPDGRTVAFLGHEHGEAGAALNGHMMVVPARGGAAPRSISAAIDNSANALPGITPSFAWLPGGKTIVFLVQERGTQAMYRTDVRSGAATKVLDGERQILQFSLSADGREIAFTAAWASNPTEVYATKLGSDARERNLSRCNDELLAAASLGATRRMTHRASDGLDIESFVIYPPDYRSGKRRPLVLYIHGGPHGQHPGMGFSMRTQTLAAAGYVVLLPNPRGSSGYGEKFTQMCVGDWGGKDYDDLMTAVDALVQKGVADPDRLFVTGYSYGGFMTGWVVGHTNRFRAAIIGAPVADHISMRGTTEIPGFSDYEHGGNPWNRLDHLWERSPLAHLPNCTTPVLIEHHEGDLRCPVGQSEEIFQTLKILGKEAEFIRYPGGFHTLDFHTPAQDVDYMQRQTGWFDEHGGAVRPRKRRTAVAPTARSRNGLTRNGASANGAAKAVRTRPATSRRKAASER